jgi:hypothetical protein
MQTFLPYGRSFRAGAKVLDRQRLGKQRVEGLQILRTITGLSYGWANHPAVKMWDGYPEALAQYTIDVCNEWTSRGFKDSCLDKVLEIVPLTLGQKIELPDWIDDIQVSLSHKANLVRKLPEYYGKLWPNVDPLMPYKWPVR